MKWLGPGVFSHNGKDIAPGNEMPKIDKERMNSFIKDGFVGDIAEKLDPEVFKQKMITDLKKDKTSLEKSLSKSDKKADSLKGRIVELEKKLEGSETEELETKVSELEDSVLDLTGKLEASEKVVKAFEKKHGPLK